MCGLRGLCSESSSKEGIPDGFAFTGGRFEQIPGRKNPKWIALRWQALVVEPRVNGQARFFDACDSAENVADGHVLWRRLLEGSGHFGQEHVHPFARRMVTGIASDLGTEARDDPTRRLGFEQKAPLTVGRSPVPAAGLPCDPVQAAKRLVRDVSSLESYEREIATKRLVAPRKDAHWNSRVNRPLTGHRVRHLDGIDSSTCGRPVGIDGLCGHVRVDDELSCGRDLGWRVLRGCDRLGLGRGLAFGSDVKRPCAATGNRAGGGGAGDRKRLTG
jgi:hypothetical protein